MTTCNDITAALSAGEGVAEGAARRSVAKILSTK